MPLVPIQYADMIAAGLIILYGIIREPHYVGVNSAYWNAASLVATWLTTPLATELTLLLVGYVIATYIVLRAIGQAEASGTKSLGRFLAWALLGSRAYGSMLLAIALYGRGMLTWVGGIQQLASMGPIGYILGGWVAILVGVHIVGIIIKGLP